MLRGTVSVGAISEGDLRVLLAPYVEGSPVPAGMYAQLLVYLELLVRWNRRTNLTAVRSPGEVVRRHFGESLFAGRCLAGYLPTRGSLLDFGSGAGFPGLPIQLLLPELQVTLAESQGKKAAFLREAVRVLGVRAEVWAGRVEDTQASERYDAVALRAVDDIAAMTLVGRSRVVPGGVLVRFTTEAKGVGEHFAIPERRGSFVEIGRVEV